MELGFKSWSMGLEHTMRDRRKFKRSMIALDEAARKYGKARSMTFLNLSGYCEYAAIPSQENQTIGVAPLSLCGSSSARLIGCSFATLKAKRTTMDTLRGEHRHAVGQVPRRTECSLGSAFWCLARLNLVFGQSHRWMTLSRIFSSPCCAKNWECAADS